MSSAKSFKQVDVFSQTKFKGNPVAVFYDADDLTDSEMQQIARWTNLAETTFVLKPTTREASYRLRIFTVLGELPFAGHPTLGSCYALIELGLIQPNSAGLFVQECAAGLVEIKPIGSLTDLRNLELQFKLPYYRFEYLVDQTTQMSEIAKLLGVSHEKIITEPVLVDDGPRWLVVQLDDNESVIGLKPDFSYMVELSHKYNWSGISAFGKDQSSETEFELRNFCPGDLLEEDAACGSGAGSVGAYLGAHLKSGHTKLKLSQGRCIGRDATLNVSIENGGTDVFVRGAATTCIVGTY
ncbi:uncharacterized protein KQ657_001948 [Scheffersomyces spartinae]|uniref:Uncharacterized protein n=1 Tax=Scheffersomyces spartinae TaxID=45513 RepID=A0A9P7V6F5_9ASCO|nr:uncharacterized protein KQ657_001948 [Scheffersomyces spartinae]KAG7192230.1 hypothetical protein KQ657_001948 [Scheffersomyces spartinae]